MMENKKILLYIVGKIIRKRPSQTWEDILTAY
jgi:hypothetical protein